MRKEQVCRARCQRQHTRSSFTSSYCPSPASPPDLYLEISQHTTAYVSIRQHTSDTSAYVNVSIRQHTSAYVARPLILRCPTLQKRKCAPPPSSGFCEAAVKKLKMFSPEFARAVMHALLRAEQCRAAALLTAAVWSSMCRHNVLP